MKTTIAILLFAVFAACTGCVTTKQPSSCDPQCFTSVKIALPDGGVEVKPTIACEASCYAYTGGETGVTKAECEAQCASYGYNVIGIKNGGCVCDTSSCARSRQHGGCEKLPVTPD